MPSPNRVRVAALQLALAAAGSTGLAGTLEVRFLRFPSRPLPEVVGAERLRLEYGPGSGLIARRDGDRELLYLLTDRGPNIECDELEELLGARCPPLAPGKKGRLFTHPGYSPRIYPAAVSPAGELEVGIPVELRGPAGHRLTGIPNPLRLAEREHLMGPDRGTIPESLAGVDTEALASHPDGGYLVGEEFGPSILRVDEDGTVRERWVPRGLGRELRGSPVPTRGVLPAILRRRRVNRGIESLAVRGRTLWFLLQSPLAHPDWRVAEASRWVRLYAMDLDSMEVTGRWIYPTDRAATYTGERRKKRKQKNVRVCDLAALPGGALLVLERVNREVRIYRVRPDATSAYGAVFDRPTLRPTLEEHSAEGLDAAGVTPLEKVLVLDLEKVAGTTPKMEGMAVLDSRTLYLVNDNDFGIRGDPTVLIRLRFPRPLARVRDAELRVRAP